MCLVLDTNVFGAFFDSENVNHKDFQPALLWVVNGKGKLVIGGTKYKAEMKSAKKFIRIFTSFERAGKLVLLSDADVDRHEAELKRIETNPDFDDPHLVAIILASECRVVCTNDKRALPYLKRSEFYKGKVKKPKIYQSIRNTSLLSDKYISDICSPCIKLNKSQAASLGVEPK
jgi:predicted nucleic acid-binding protein